MSTEFRSTQGLRRIVNAFGYSCAGLRHAMRHQMAIRQELIALAVRWLLVLSMMLVLRTGFSTLPSRRS